MKYTVEITDAAQKDFENIFSYISEKLYNKQAATKLIALLDKNIRLLEDTPKAYPLANDEYLKNKGIRLIPVNNYIIFFTVISDEQKVHIVRIIYGKRNWIDILKQKCFDK